MQSTENKAHKATTSQLQERSPEEEEPPEVESDAEPPEWNLWRNIGRSDNDSDGCGGSGRS